MTADNTVLIVEDEPKIASLLVDYLEQSAFATHWLDRGGPVVDWVREHEPALVLLDLMLPEKDGLTICREIRTFSPVPIIMITARVEEIDRLLGLELGADDYICKPFSPREVVARVKAILRRARWHGTAPPDTPHGLRLDEDSYRATVDGQALELTPVEFRMLKALMDNPGRVFSRDQLIDRVYTDGRVVSDRTMDTHIKNLRRKLAAAIPDTGLIHSVYGVGYRFE